MKIYWSLHVFWLRRAPFQGHTAGCGRLTTHSWSTEERELMGSCWQNEYILLAYGTQGWCFVPCLTVLHTSLALAKICAKYFFFFSFPEANKNDLLYPDKKTQNVSVGYMLFFYCSVDIRLIIYLSQQVWVRFHLEGLSLVTVFTDRKPACFLSFPSAV